MLLCRSIDVASKGDSKATRLRCWIAEHQPARVGDKEIEQIRAALGPVSEGYLRRLLRASGVALAPVVEGVVQDDSEELARTLRALQAEYEAADGRQRMRIRQVVIQAKDHCRWTLRRSGNTAEREREKREALLWMSTWLENPPLFDTWLAIRRRS
jgi:hypothetical protein